MSLRRFVVALVAVVIGSSVARWGVAGSTTTKGSAIKKRKFSTPGSTPWTSGGSATYHGVFDSARRAHGTAVFQVFISGSGCQFSRMANTGTAQWRSKR